MRLRYRELINRPVIATDGKNIGRLVDLTAGRHEDGLYIEGLLVGPGALIRRIGFQRGGIFRGVPSWYIPWSLVARIDERIYLRVSSDELQASADDGGATAAANSEERG